VGIAAGDRVDVVVDRDADVCGRLDEQDIVHGDRELQKRRCCARSIVDFETARRLAVRAMTLLTSYVHTKPSFQITIL
jgi:sRNA-binding protein